MNVYTNVHVCTIPLTDKVIGSLRCKYLNNANIYSRYH